MKKTVKVLVFLFSAVGLLLSLAVLSLFYPIGPVTETVQKYRDIWPVINSILAGFAALLCLCFALLFLLALFLPSRSGMLTFARGGSLLQFSRKAVEAAVRYCIRDIPAIKSAHIRAGIRRQPEKTKIFVRLTLDESSGLMNLAETVKETIETALQASLGVAVQSVHIKVAEFQPAQGTAAAAPAEKPVSERVV